MSTETISTETPFHDGKSRITHCMLSNNEYKIDTETVSVIICKSTYVRNQPLAFIQKDCNGRVIVLYIGFVSCYIDGDNLTIQRVIEAIGYTNPSCEGNCNVLDELVINAPFNIISVTSCHVDNKNFERSKNMIMNQTMYTITPFHDGITDLPTLYSKIHDCKQVSRISGRDASGHNIYIVLYWDTVEKKTLVYHNNKYIYVTCDLPISINHILKALGLSYLDVTDMKQFVDDKPVTPDNKMLDMPILETMMSLVELTANIHNNYYYSGHCDDYTNHICGDGIDSDDYDSE